MAVGKTEKNSTKSQCQGFLNCPPLSFLIAHTLVALKSTQHRPADVLSNTLSQAQSSRCSKVKNLRKNRNWIRKWKKAVSILGDWTFFSPDWRRSFHSPYILKGKSVFCDWLECLPFYIVPYSMYGPVHRGESWTYFVQLWINLFEKN